MIALIVVAQGRGVKALRSRRKGPREQVNAELLNGGIVWFVLHEVPNPVRPGAVARLQLGDGKVPLDPVVVGIKEFKAERARRKSLAGRSTIVWVLVTSWIVVIDPCEMPKFS